MIFCKHDCLHSGSHSTVRNLKPATRKRCTAATTTPSSRDVVVAFMSRSSGGPAPRPASSSSSRARSADTAFQASSCMNGTRPSPANGRKRRRRAKPFRRLRLEELDLVGADKPAELDDARSASRHTASPTKISAGAKAASRSPACLTKTHSADSPPAAVARGGARGAAAGGAEEGPAPAALAAAAAAAAADDMAAASTAR